MLTADKIRELHGKAVGHNKEIRDERSKDLTFYWISQWLDGAFDGATLQVRMQFDQIRKCGRQIISDIKTNPIQVDFEPVAGTDDKLADIMDGMYRSRMRTNMAIEAKENAVTEAIVCGFGAFERFTEFKQGKKGKRTKVISRRPIFEANNVAFCDPNAKLNDKSDAEYWSILVPYSEDGYKKVVSDLTGENLEDISLSSFSSPDFISGFQWCVSNDTYYVARFYHKETVLQTMAVLTDMLGSEKEVIADDESAIEDLMADGYDLTDEYEREYDQITQYIVGGGGEILSTDIIPGEVLPVTPVYGERAFVDGIEHYEGITKLAKDPQTLRNFIGSYVADIASSTPRISPIYLQEQIAGFEQMYSPNGADDVYPYRLQNAKDADGNQLPLGPIGQTPDQPIPSSAIAAFDLAEQAISDVAGANVPQNISDTDLSGEALKELRGRMESQSYIYQHNLKSALRHDASGFVSMASSIHDIEEDVTVVRFDGTKTEETINKPSVDVLTLQSKVENDIKNAQFEVYADVGPSYNSMQEQSKRETKDLLFNTPPDDPMRQILMLQWHTMQEGSINKPLRDYARKQLIQQGIYEPETDEEKQMMIEMQAAQGEQQDPQMMLAQAEAQARLQEGQAAIQNEINDANKLVIDKQRADNDTAKVQIQAAEAGVNIDLNKARADGIKIDNVSKLSRPVRQLMQQ